MTWLEGLNPGHGKTVIQYKNNSSNCAIYVVL